MIKTEINKQLHVAQPKVDNSKAVKKTKNGKDTVDDQPFLNISGIKIPVGLSAKSILKAVNNAADTTKKIIKVKADSVTYIINGVSATDGDFVAISSKDTAKLLNKNIKAIKVDGINAYVTKSLKADTTKTVAKVTDKNFNFVARPTTSLLMYSAVNAGNQIKMTDKDGVTIISPKIEYTGDKTQTTDMADKVYVIDGKEATRKQMKKLSAGDIEKITIKDGAEMIKEYGDKAKKGVIFITTKKPK